jgi:integrase
VSARRVVLPRLSLTELASESDPGAVLMKSGLKNYWVRPLRFTGEFETSQQEPALFSPRFNLFPLVLERDGAPWAEAVIYIITRLESQRVARSMTCLSIAEDLAAFRRFLDERLVDWQKFPLQKLERPTYRFNGYLKQAIGAGEISPSTAKRRIATVVNFYRWLSDEKLFLPSNPPWKESDHYVRVNDSQGFARTKKVVTTDVRIQVPQQNDPYDGCIEDGGKLRPLQSSEQEALVNALTSLGNTEMTLIHFLSLLTGARIQTVLTLRVRHVSFSIEELGLSEVRLPVGLGTGVDTKFDKRMVLMIPRWLYVKLQIYAASDRARKRRLLATGGDLQNQYLFLSRRGQPFYTSKADLASFDDQSKLRHAKNGQAVRQFIYDKVIPLVRKDFSWPQFRYQFHDLRASAGMNWTDEQLSLVESGRTTLHAAREFVKTRMGHSSAAVTDRYLNYRGNLRMVRQAEAAHESHIQRLMAKALTGDSP